MIEAADVVERLHRRGMLTWSGVPCSFLTPLIDHVMGRAGLRYVAAANEGDAVATAAGSVLGGIDAVVLLQNSGLGNAVNPLTSLIWPFRIPILLIVTWRGEPGLGDEPQHQLMGGITSELLEAMQIPWSVFPQAPSELDGSIATAMAHLEGGRPYAWLVRRGSISRGPETPPARRLGVDGRQRPSRVVLSGPESGARREDRTERPTREAALRLIVDRTATNDTVVIAATGHTGRQLYGLSDRPNHLYMVGSMGCAASVGLGLALTRPDRRVVVVDGDGAVLMRMGAMATTGAYGRSNLIHLVLDNGQHASTGGQGTVSPGLSFAGIAAACGYSATSEGSELSVLDEALSRRADDTARPRFCALRIQPGSVPDLPRPRLAPVEVKERLMEHLGPPPRFDLPAAAGSGPPRSS